MPLEFERVINPLVRHEPAPRIGEFSPGIFAEFFLVIRRLMTRFRGLLFPCGLFLR